MENETLVEYVICVKDASDLESLYEDLETPGGSETIPDRKIECLNRRPISRNTHYMLTDEESVLISNDPRVQFTEKILPRKYAKKVLAYTHSSNNWDKAEYTESNDKNWGLLRCVEGIQRSDWGTDNTPNVIGDVTLTSSGKGVDVVIADGHVYADHPEFAVNPDGTGGTRVKQYNWYQHTPAITGGASGNYEYPPKEWLGNGTDNHGTHVAGTVAGNSQGWARDADIYNITFSDHIDVKTDYPGTYTNVPQAYLNIGNYVFDYIRLFHTTKTTNRPTIVNNSWGENYGIVRSKIVSIIYKGNTITKPSGGFTDAQLESYGLLIYDNTWVIIDLWSDADIVNITDAINAGVIIVACAMNTSSKADIYGVNNDYNNRITFKVDTDPTIYGAYYARGNWVLGAPGSICVGAISELTNDSKAFYSNCGPRVDIYAPGTWIQSSVYNGNRPVGTNPVGVVPVADDPRNPIFKLKKYRGTSMAAPQVTGLLACVLENYPRMKSVDCLNYIINTAKVDQITDSGGSYTDYTSLQGGPNRYLFYKKERTTTGMITAQLTTNVRKPSGMMFPRRRFI